MVKHMKKKSMLPKQFHDKKLMATVFLGVGITLFMVNITSFLSYLPAQYSFTAFDLSVFSSMLIIIYSVYSLHEEK